MTGRLTLCRANGRVVHAFNYTKKRDKVRVMNRWMILYANKTGWYIDVLPISDERKVGTDGRNVNYYSIERSKAIPAMVDWDKLERAARGKDIEEEKTTFVRPKAEYSNARSLYE